MLVTTSMLIHPIKTSLFIYLQLQPPDMRGMSPPPTFQTHRMQTFFKDAFHFSDGIFTFRLDKFTHLTSCTHVCTLSVSCSSCAHKSLILSGYELDSRNYICDTNPASQIEHFIPELSPSLFITSYSP